MKSLSYNSVEDLKRRLHSGHSNFMCLSNLCAEALVKAKQLRSITDRLPRNGEGKIVCIGDTQWVNGDDGPVVFIVEQMTALHSGGIGIRGTQIVERRGFEPLVQSQNSSISWHKTTDCYNTREALEKGKE